MANKEKGTRTSIDELNDSLSSMEQKVESNKKLITWAIGAVIAIAILVLGYIYLIYTPNVEKAKEAIAKADTDLAMGQDSIALKEYEAISDGFNNSASNRAALNAAILLYQKGKYQDALNYLKDYDAKGIIVGPASQSLMGDCYVNLKNYDEAVGCFDKAISLCNGNSLYAPVFMMKKATVLREQKKFTDEAEILQTIKDKYPVFAASYQIDIDKYLERANAEAGK